MTAPTPKGVGAVLVVKHLNRAKTRLAQSGANAGAPPEIHRALVLAMLLDTVDAVIGAGLDPIVVVTPDPHVRMVVGRLGVTGLAEEDRRHPTLNHAYAQGAQWIRNHHPDCDSVLMVQADLPAATAASIREVVAAGVGHRRALVADADRVGTAVLLRPAADADLPLFGADSAGAHRDAGAHELDPAHDRWADLRIDVDTAADLRRAVEVGVGVHTRAVIDASVYAAMESADGAAAPPSADAS